MPFAFFLNAFLNKKTVWRCVLVCWIALACVPLQKVWAAPLLLNDAGNAGRQLSRLLGVLDKQQNNIIGIQRELVARPAIDPTYQGAGEEEKARWIENWLWKNGLTVERFDYSDERVPGKTRPNLVAFYPPGSSNARQVRTLWLLAHFDVAASGPRDNWQSDPFALKVDGDRMYGRGTEDNNQAITVSLILLESLRQQKLVPPVRLGFVFCSGALTDYRIGIGHVLARRPTLFTPDDLVLVMDYGKASGNEIAVGEKGNMWLKVSVTGKAAHASVPHTGVNAFAAAAQLVNDLRSLETKFPAANALFSPPYSTFTPTRTESHNSGINHIPAGFVFYIDTRVMPGYSFDDVETAVRKLADQVEQTAGVTVLLQRVEETPPAGITRTNSLVVKALDRSIKAELGLHPRYIGTGSVTMAASIRAMGIPVAVWGIQETQHNQVNEHASIAAHVKQAKVIARMLFDPALVASPAFSKQPVEGKISQKNKLPQQ